MEQSIFIALSFLLSLSVGWVVLPRIILISKKKRLFDTINDRKSHSGAIPRLGGIAFLPCFMLSVTITIGLRYLLGYTFPDQYLTMVVEDFMLFIAGATILYLTGIADDLLEIGFRRKFLSQFAAALLLVLSGNIFNDLQGFLGIHAIPNIAGAIFTVIFVIFIINAYNLIDGIDGLCSGLSLLALGFLGTWFWSHCLYIYATIALAMAGTVATFFIYNTFGNRLKIFMGDTGSLTLGFTISFLILKFFMFTDEIPSCQIVHSLPIILGLVFVPAFDTLRVFCVRIYNGLSPFYPDRRHIHHKVLRLGFTHLQSTAFILLVQLFFIVFNTLLREMNMTLLVGINLILGVCLTFTLNKLGGIHEAKIKAKQRK